MNSLDVVNSSSSSSAAGVVEKTEQEFLEIIPQRLLEEWDSHSLNTPRTRWEYLAHQYALFLKEETQVSATANSLSSVANRSVLATMAAPPAVDQWVTYIGTIASDLAWINPEFAPFIMVGVDTALTLYQVVFGNNNAQSSALAQALDNVANQIKLIRNDIARLDHKIEQQKLDEWTAKITTGAGTIHDFKDSLLGITDRPQLVDEMNHKFAALPANLLSMHTVCTEIAINEDLKAGAPYQVADFPRVMTKLKLLISACVVRLAMANLEVKRSMIILPNSNEVHAQRYKEFHDCTVNCQAILKAAVSCIINRMKASCLPRDITTNDHVFIQVPSDKSRLDNRKKPTMGIVQVNKTDSVSNPQGGTTTVHRPTEYYRVTAKEHMPVGSKSVNIAIKVPYPCVEITDCLGSPSTVFYYDDDIIQQTLDTSGDPKHTFSKKDIMVNVNAEIHAWQSSGSLHQKELELNKLLADTLGKFTTTLSVWSAKDKSNKPVSPYQPLTPSDPTHAPTYDDKSFTVKTEGANTVWHLPQVAVSYGIQYINSIGSVSGIVWGPTIMCKAQGAPTLSSIIPPDEKAQVAGIRVWRRFTQLGKPIEGLHDTMVVVLARKKSLGGKFQTSFTDTSPALIPSKK